jgi:hypothetical protein
MTVEDLMTQAVTVRRPTGFDQSPSGEPFPIFTESQTVMYLEPKQDTRRSTEALEVGYVPTALWLGVGRADFDFQSHDQIVYGDTVFDIIAPVRPMTDPLTATVSHKEMDLQAVGEDEVSVDAVAHPDTVGGVGG